MKIDEEELIKQIKENAFKGRYVNCEILVFQNDTNDKSECISKYDFDDGENLDLDLHLSTIKTLYALAITREQALLEVVDDEEIRELMKEDIEKHKEDILKGALEDEK